MRCGGAVTDGHGSVPFSETPTAKEAKNWLRLSGKSPRLRVRHDPLGIKVCTKW